MKNKDFTIINLGLGLLLQLPFADNGVLSGKRTFLVIGEEDNHILLLNVSSTKGKEHKLLLDSNEIIINYNPPFKVSSFVKFDALYKVEKCVELKRCILCKSQTLDSNEFDRLYVLYANYIKFNSFQSSVTTSEELNAYLIK